MARYTMALVAMIALSAFFAIADASAVQAGDSNFDSVVLNSGKNSFVKFLAPW